VSPPAVSVVIPTKNRRRDLERTLQALDRQTDLAAPFEVVVSDDGSSDDTPAYLASRPRFASYSLKSVRLPGRGPAAARNRAIEAASAARVLLLGDDTAPDARTVAIHAQESGRGVQGRIEWDPEAPITSVMEFLAPAGPQFYFKNLENGRPIPYTALLGSNLSAPTHWFRDDPFDERFPAAAFEDTELGYRWHLRGRVTVYSEAAVCRHRHHYGSIEPFLEKQRRAGEGARYAVRRHPAMAGRTVLQPLGVGLLFSARYGLRRAAGTSRAADLWDLQARLAFLKGLLSGTGTERAGDA
jgi:glycosyltransferase involved in cell wall biosynthesis